MTGQRAVGLDLGGTAIKWALLDGDEVIDHGRAPTPKTGAEAVVVEMVAIAKRIPDVDSIGVGVPGIFDKDGTTQLIPNVRGSWEGFPLGQSIEQQLGIPVTLSNDATAFTLAELRLGAGRGFSDIVCVTLGTGVGGGVTIGGKIHLGRSERAGELGHQTFSRNGPRCGCGSNGCVETYASAPAIVARAARAVLQGVDTSLRDACGGDVGRLTPEIVVAEAHAGDQFASDVIQEAGEALGVGLANVCSALAPELIVVGGGLGAALDVLRPAIEETMKARVPMRDPCPVVGSALGPLSGSIGAALWSRESLDVVAEQPQA